MRAGGRFPLVRATRWSAHDYGSPGAYFITICSHQRLTIFEEPAIAAVIHEAWHELPRHFPLVTLDAFVVMPNHVHGIVVLSSEQPSVASQHAGTLRRAATLSVVVRSFKSAVTRQVRIQGLLDAERFWQPNYYDRVIRDEAELDRIREYTAYNPIAWQFDHENPIMTRTQTIRGFGAGSRAHRHDSRTVAAKHSEAPRVTPIRSL
jgi:REP element-mobilizing transposase RayT